MQWNRYGDDYGTNAAAMYERYLAPLFLPWARELVERATLQPGERMLDVGCGTGVVTRAAVEVVETAVTVVGLDYNRAMLAIARELGPAMSWCGGSADALPCATAAFD